MSLILTAFIISQVYRILYYICYLVFTQWFCELEADSGSSFAFFQSLFFLIGELMTMVILSAIDWHGMRAMSRNKEQKKLHNSSSKSSQKMKSLQSGSDETSYRSTQSPSQAQA